MDKVTVVMLYISIVIVASGSNCQNSFRCGPRELCKCVRYKCSLENITMDCSGQGLTSLGEICETVGNTAHLVANSNRINGTLHDDIRMNGCGKLLSLSLRNNTITDLEQNAVSKLKSVIAFDISHNRLAIYRSKQGYLFENLEDLESLALNGNRVNNSDKCQQYPDLSSNKKLTTLYIDGLPGGKHLINVSSNLKKLVMSGADNSTCQIQYISDIYLQHLVKLETLDLSICDIELIELNAFSALRNLQWLDLSNNRRLGIKGLYNISYSLQFTNIKFLNYSYIYPTFGLGREISKVDICFLRNTTLREIALDGNRIQLMETNLVQLLPPTLQVVHMNDNIFTFAPYLLQLGCASNVTEFYGSYQNLAHNPTRYKNYVNTYTTKSTHPIQCPYMEDSYLKHVSDRTENCKFFKQNETITIYPTFPKLIKNITFNDCNMKYKIISMVIIPIHNNIEYMNASGNVLYTWKGPIGPFPKLKTLDLSRNYCSLIERKFFEYMKRLENLQIHNNLIGLAMSNDEYGDVFHDLIHLKTLNLSMNKITRLHPKSFKDLANLENLDLSFNNMETWDLEVETMSNLTHVNLRSNAFQSLPNQLTKHLYRTAKRKGTAFSIDLRNNTLRYGCQTRKFLTWMVNHKASFIGFEEYVFVDDDGAQLSNHDIEYKVNGLDKMCRSNTIWIVISVIGVSVALSIIIGGLLYRNRWKLRYVMYMSKQRFYGYVRVPNEDPLENYKYDAFISYAEENIRFVKDQVIPNVETGGISLCIHQRDFLPGNAIADNIIDAIKSSRKTVILLTKAFLKRRWCIYEFNMARMENIYSRDGRGCLVIVMLEPVPAKEMTTELLDWIKQESYLEYSTDEAGELLFWNNLKDAISNSN